MPSASSQPSMSFHSAGRAAAGEAGSPALEHGPATVLANVLKAANDKTVVVALGNPYLIAQYPAIQNYVCTFSNVPGLGAERGQIPLWRNSRPRPSPRNHSRHRQPRARAAAEVAPSPTSSRTYRVRTSRLS